MYILFIYEHTYVMTDIRTDVKFTCLPYVTEHNKKYNIYL